MDTAMEKTEVSLLGRSTVCIAWDSLIKTGQNKLLFHEPGKPTDDGFYIDRLFLLINYLKFIINHYNGQQSPLFLTTTFFSSS